MAANEGIQISMSQVSECAGNIRTINSELNVCLENIRTKMNALSAGWKSEAGDTILANFTKMSASFEEYKMIIDSYAAFLDDVVTAYRTTESSITQNAELFK
ncbi:MAG: pore-forming ESAT-6 family protein [Oliverpabstia sp.]